tara:strand:+ start:15238 stop:16032 length:795 start_codon:yes stop_codon:yes gene_type:complete
VRQGFTLRLAGLEGGLSRSEFLYRQLSAEIINGVYTPGDRLDEASIAKRFDVSRTPVREALQALVSSGLAFRLRHRGVMVATLGRRRLNEMFEVMADVEALCAGYAAERMTAEERYRLDAFHQDSARLVRDGDPLEYAKFNTSFHSAIYSGAHNDFLAESAESVRRRLNPFRGAQFRLDRRMVKSFEEHQAIVDAILRGDAEGARAATIAHVRVVGEVSETFAGEDGDEHGDEPGDEGGSDGRTEDWSQDRSEDRPDRAGEAES